MTKKFPIDFTQTTSDVSDLLPFADISDAYNLKKDTIENIVKVGMSGNSTDDLPQGVNKYMTVAEKTKLSGIQPGAEENRVDSVNGHIGTISLDQDDIYDGDTYKRTHNDYTDADKNLVVGYQTHQTRIDNPHTVTKAQVGLSLVTNHTQLKRIGNDYNTFATKINPSDNDIILVEDSLDGNNKKKVTLTSILNSVGNSMIAFSNRCQNSLEVIGGKLQLLNDEVNPNRGKAYMTKGTPGRYYPFPSNIVNAGEILIIGTDESLIVSREFKSLGTTIIAGNLHIL